MPRRYLFDEVKRYIEIDSKSQYKLISNKYINNKIKLEMLCNYGHLLHMAFGNFKQGQRCSICKGNKRKTTEIFKQQVYDLIKDEYIVIGEYINAFSYILMKHKSCNTNYKVRPYSFLDGHRCPVCANNQIKTTDQFKEEVKNIVGEEYSVLGKYIKNYKEILMRHNLCNNNYVTTPSRFLSGCRCTVCNESKGEQRIRKYLTDNKIYFDSQYRTLNLLSKNKRPLRFDFVTYKNKDKSIINKAIEFDGIQHYEFIEGWIKKDKFENLQYNDKLKTQFCINNKIELIRIPYFKFNDIEIILDEKLS